jgi:dephospho-CoA kinase
MAPGAPAYKPVVDTFGQFILDGEKNINRGLLGQIVFANPAALQKLEAIVHPIVGQAIGTLIGRAPQKVVVIEAIKLLEGDLGKGVDEIWVVDASPETRLKRLMTQRKLAEDVAKQRIAAQGSQADKLAKANVVIKNDGNVEETWKQVHAAFTNIQKKLTTGTMPAVAQPAQAAPAASAPAQSAPAAPAQPPPARPAASTMKTAPLPARPTVPTPPPAAAKQDSAPTVPSVSGVRVNVKRGMPSNAEVIASFISGASTKSVSRMDVMMAFGQKSYLLAQDATDRVLAVMGWQVENLITRVDEFYMLSDAPIAPVIEGLVTAVEAASKDLQSEVAYIFLPASAAPEAVQSFARNGYEATTVEQIKIPAWREAVQEIISEDKSTQIFSKKLREDRVLKPI